MTKCRNTSGFSLPILLGRSRWTEAEFELTGHLLKLLDLVRQADPM